MPESSISKKLESVLGNLATKAGKAVMEFWKAGNFDTDWKPDGTPVTRADLAADQIIQTGLATEFPGIPVVSEETRNQSIPNSNLYFLVDPIDGTSGFRRGKSDFTVNIALIENNAPCAGVVFAPAFDRMFITPYYGRLVEYRDGRRRVCEQLGRVYGPVRVVASRARRTQPLIRNYLTNTRTNSFNFIASSIKFCLLASGEADLYPRFGRTMEWDTAAGQAVLEAVGGRVLQLKGLRPLVYGKADFKNPNFVATVPGVRLPGQR